MVRIKLACRAAENLLLTDEVLNSLKTEWQQLQEKIKNWLEGNTEHSHYQTMSEFVEKDFDRMNYDIKKIRNDLMGIIGSAKPWEVAVGQTIAGLAWNESTKFDREGSIYTFLGAKAVKNLIQRVKR